MDPAEYRWGVRELQLRLAAIEKVLGSLMYSQKEVESTLDKLVEVLHECIKLGEESTRNECFSRGIVKSLLGILRSSTEVSMLSKATCCLAVLVHNNEEGRIILGEMGAIPVLLELLNPTKKRENASPWPKEWIPVYEQVVICLRKLTFYNADNQLELARIGGIKLIVAMVRDKSLLSNYGQFSPEAKEYLEEVVLQKKFISKVCSVPESEREAALQSFSGLDTPALILHYPAFYVELMDKDGCKVTSSLCERGLVWPDSSLGVPEPSKWTCVVVQSVEDGDSLWCQFCTQSVSEPILLMNKVLKDLVCPCNYNSLL